MLCKWIYLLNVHSKDNLKESIIDYIFLFVPAYVHMCVFAYVYIYTIVDMWKSEENLWKFVLYFHTVGSGHKAWVFRFKNKYIYLLSYLTESLYHNFYKIICW